MITTQDELQEFIKLAKESDSIAVDTEFVWERTYYPQLGLIQVGLSNDDCRLIDPVALKDLSPLGEVLSDPNIIKIFHDAPQDLSILHQATGALPKNIFDTRLAAGFCGMPSTLSLSNLIRELLEISLPKTETRTNWIKRPLDIKQIEYAEDDVRYLRAARVILLTRVYSPEVKSFLEEEMQGIENPKNFTPMADELRYRKVKGAGGLSRKSLAILKQLASWREQMAKTKNRPRGHIVPDPVLLAIAKNALATKTSISEESGISTKALGQYHDDIVEAVNNGISCPENELPESLKLPRLSSKDKTDVEKLTKMIRLKSDTKGIDSIIVATSSELKCFIKWLSSPSNYPELRQNGGWRKGYFEEFLK